MSSSCGSLICLFVLESSYIPTLVRLMEERLDNEELTSRQNSVLLHGFTLVSCHTLDTHESVISLGFQSFEFLRDSNGTGASKLPFHLGRLSMSELSLLSRASGL